ncbi:leucine-rich repeat domain-containing protein [Falsiporphyromonas endometrii]|uniref:Leucine-rich repeat protein n=1 Tax=Falsiporphyromonas endometrii TaxID=1387297 RepID=A0ABV9KAB7_9PORP
MRFKLLCIASLLASVFAANAQKVDENGVLTECSFISGEYTIPSNVKEIGEGAFFYSGVTKVTIPKSVERIEKSAFGYCQSLTDIVFEEGSHLKTVCDLAFTECIQIKEIAFPNSVDSIGRSVFTFCDNLAKVTLPTSLKRLSYGSFSSCAALKKLDIPASVKVIEDFAFGNCTNLLSIKLGQPDSIGTKAFYHCENLTSVTIPNTVKILGDSVFMRCTSLENLNIPASVEKIGDKLFVRTPDFAGYTVDEGNEHFVADKGVLYSKDKTVLYECPQTYTSEMFEVPSSVNTIRPMAFYECMNVKGIKIPDGLAGLGIAALANNGMTKFDFAGNDKYFSILGNIYVKLKEDKGLALLAMPTKSEVDSLVVAPGTIMIADMVAMNNTNLKKVYIPESLQFVGARAFYGCTGLSDIYAWPKKAPKLLEQAFAETIFPNVQLHVYAGSAESYQLASWPFAYGDDITDETSYPEVYPTSSESISDAKVSVVRNAEDIVISANKEIRSVHMYGMAGNMEVALESVNNNVAILPVPSQGNIYIVKIVFADNSSVVNKI